MTLIGRQMNLTLDEQRRLAELVTGEPAKIDYEYDEHLVLFGGELQEWKPSIAPDAEDWQVAQACRVIVAAFNLPGFIHVGRNRNGTFYFLGDWNAIETEIAQHSDLLEAAARALLGAQS